MILVFALPIPLSMLYYGIKKEMIKEEVRCEIIPKVDLSQTIVLRFNIDDLDKLFFERDDEFEYNSVMYDVVKEERRDDQVIFYCIEDDEESELKKSIRQQISDNFNSDPSNHNFYKNLYSFLNSLFKNDDFIYNLNLYYYNINFHLISSKTLMSYFSSDTPPPNISL